LIGHTLIVVVLLGVISDDARSEVSLVRRSWLVPAAYATALATFLTLYYAGHALLFGTSIA
jgi:hypothetical protein